jgi:hypothetical protein
LWFGGEFLSDWPGGMVGGDVNKKNFAIAEPKISEDGTYYCPICKEGFVTRQRYDDHYINAHTKAKVAKNYPLE